MVNVAPPHSIVNVWVVSALCPATIFAKLLRAAAERETTRKCFLLFLTPWLVRLCSV